MDSRMSCKLLRSSFIKMLCLVKVTQDWRCLIRAKVSATRSVTRHVNEIGSLLRNWFVRLVIGPDQCLFSYHIKALRVCHIRKHLVIMACGFHCYSVFRIK